MKVEEAIHRLETHKEYISPHGRFTKEAIDMAIEALKKHIPKEPIWECDGYADGEMIYDRWYCPRCDMDYDAEYEKHDYCPVCGQKILWEEK